MRLFTFLFILLATFTTFSQSTYRTTANEHYWKNTPPNKSYWQQDVHYNIEATIDDSLDIIEGTKYELTYWNNSPHLINELYFHVYQNAFQPNSHMHDLYTNNDIKVEFGKYEKEGLGTTIDNLQVNGQYVKTELDNTILKIILNKPLEPNDSLVVSLKFKTYFDTGTLRRRMKTFTTDGNKHYDAVHWYPSIAVYDKKFAWTTEQHLDKEFYADFGSFDVSLTFPTNYIVDATGTLQNRNEVLPDTLRKALDISNFSEKSDTLKLILPRIEGKSKTWRFYAENVHNFAFTADPLYRIGELEWKGIKVVTLAQEQNAYGWQKSGEFTKNVIKTYSTDFGMYAWPKIIVADAKDGMEYPMLTLDNGTYPRHQSLLAHEVGHMWFYGMVGTNETYRAMMDEGFTQFLTIWSLNDITGKSKARKSNSKYIEKRLMPYRHRYERLYYPYIKTVVNDNDMPLNTHSSDFNGATRHAGNYGLVYYKTGVMLYNLRYVLGEELFLNAMKHYFNQWKMAHPYPDDFRNSITEFTKVDLNWFFDQWMETTKNIDYSIKNVTQINDTTTNIVFERIGDMQMPIDFIAITKSNDTLHYHIPNTWFIKDTEATILPKWYGWGNLHKTHHVSINSSSPIKNIIIDPDHYLADINLSNNTWKGFNKVQFDHRVKNLSDWEHSNHFIRPDIWYNNLDGIQSGIHLEGNYFDNSSSYSATIWANTRLGQNNINTQDEKNGNLISYELETTQSTNTVWERSNINLYSLYNVGLNKSGLSFVKIFQKRDLWNPNYIKLKWNMDFMYRSTINQSDYLLFDNSWSFEQHNNTLNFSIDKVYKKNKNTGLTNFNMRTSGLYADINYSYLEFSNTNTISGKKLALKTRVYSRFGFGNTPIESGLYGNGASPEQLYENKYTRASGIIPINILNNNFHMGGGLNLRGYNYIIGAINGNSGASFNTELDFQKMISIKPKHKIFKPFSFRTYAFYDMGTISINNNKLSKAYIDAGIGSVLKINFKGLNIKPIEIRVDFPIYINPTEQGTELNNNKIIVGLNSSF